MKTGLLFIALLIASIGYTQNKQAGCWRILLKNKALVNNIGNNISSVILPSNKKGDIKLIYNCTTHPENFNRSFIIMDESRKELLRINVADKSNYCFLALSKLKELTRLQPFSIYTVSIPKDSTMATTMKIAPVLLTNVSWK